jgi:hypothetical protein
MLPKYLIPVSPGPGYEMPMHTSSEADEDDEGIGGIDGSPCMWMSTVRFESHHVILQVRIQT